jgi:Ras-related GTP-binding protein A/B
MGNLVFNLLDCGGQEEFIKQYFETKKETIFSKVEVLIFVIEAENPNNKNDKDNIEDITYFDK